MLTSERCDCCSNTGLGGVELGAITSEMWVEPLGALVKTGPAIVLMAVALVVLDAR